MLFSLRPKSTLESLKFTYSRLMSKSFKAALTDLKRSEKIQKQAEDVLDKINRIEASI